MQSEIREELEQRLDACVVSVKPVGGGDINDAFKVELSSGRSAFVKTRGDVSPSVFEIEAKGLRWLGESDAIVIPEVLAVGQQTPFLALEHIEPGRRGRNFSEDLGHQLAELHRFGASSFGLSYDNHIGSLQQQNTPHQSWAEFYREERLIPQLLLAEKAGHVTSSLARSFDEVLSTLESLVGPEEPPARLHGDLWAGNHLCSSAGQPVLIDPAVYGGHREMDLAMMKLFGGFDQRVFNAYNDAFPLAEGHVTRVPLWQLYPLMVHVNLFGWGYVSQVEQCLNSIPAVSKQY